MTERGGRPVLAVKASARSAVPGIVHDASGSGQTLFVEPFAIVELSTTACARSRAPSARRSSASCASSRALVGDARRRPRGAVDALAAIDLALACGALSRRWRRLARRAVRRGRAARRAPSPARPGDAPCRSTSTCAACARSSSAGPNTGGKTVALKTLGLAALLHQCGLRPPARVARLPVFDGVLADIGDEQSIAA